MIKICYYALIVVVLSAGFGTAARAQNIIEDQRLNFGEWVVLDNSIARTITVNAHGSYTHSDGLIMFTAPRQGIYDVTGLPSSASFTVDATMIEAMGAGSPNFTFGSFHIVNTNADGFGNATIQIGATASSTGDSQSYPDATYNGTMEIEIHL